MIISDDNVSSKAIWRNTFASVEARRCKRSSNQIAFFLIGIHSMQEWTATTKHVTRKISTKRLEYMGKLFRNNLLIKGVCWF